MAQAKDVGEYHQQHAPVARALLNIDPDTEARLKNILCSMVFMFV